MDKQKILKIFSQLVSIESVSTETKRKNELSKAVDLIKNYLLDLGLQVDIYQKENSHPLIIAKKIVSSKAKTFGFYAHYDVQPEDPVDKWLTPPFKLTLKNGKIFGRGVADDKGHLVQLLAGLKRIKNFKNNLVFIFEGEEEIGSVNFEKLIKEDDFLKKVDVFYILDVGAKSKKSPQIFYGLRGIVDFELIIETGKTDLHSGIYGNLILNPAQIGFEFFSKIKDGKTHLIKIPKFYDDVVKISIQEKKLLEKAKSPIESKVLPSLEVNGVYSGYTGEGIKTIIPHQAVFKFSIRLVPNQNWKKVKKQVEDFAKKNLPKNINYQLKTIAGSNPFYTDFKNTYVEKTDKVLKEVFQGEVIFNRSGGSIPAAETLQRVYKKPVILTGFTLPDDNLHAPNENFDEEMFWKGIEAIEKIFLL